MRPTWVSRSSDLDDACPLAWPGAEYVRGSSRSAHPEELNSLKRRSALASARFHCPNTRRGARTGPSEIPIKPEWPGFDRAYAYDIMMISSSKNAFKEVI